MEYKNTNQCAVYVDYRGTLLKFTPGETRIVDGAINFPGVILILPLVKEIKIKNTKDGNYSKDKLR